MKAIILAAGEGKRLKPITNTIPKPLIKIFGKPIIEHNLEFIYKYVSEIIIIIEYKGNLIKEYFGTNFKGTNISYKNQGEEKGTGAAIKGINFQEDVIIINGDSIFDKKDLRNLIDFRGYGILVKEVESPERYGIIKISSNKNIEKIIEKPKKFIGNLANLGAYKLNSKIFEYIDMIKSSSRGEYEITDAINIYAKNNSLKAIEIKGKFIDIGYPWDILKANNYFLNILKKSSIKGTIEDGVYIKGNIVLEKGAVLKSGTYIEGNVYIGKNSIIGPNSYIRNSSVIGDNCRIGNSVEIKESVFFDNSNAAHLSYIGNSIIGNNVNLGGGFISGNLRHDNSNIKVPINGKLIDTFLIKFGCIIGDNTKTGMNTSTYPGRIIENDTFTLPGEIVK